MFLASRSGEGGGVLLDLLSSFISWRGNKANPNTLSRPSLIAEQNGVRRLRNRYVRIRYRVTRTKKKKRFCTAVLPEERVGNTRRHRQEQNATERKKKQPPRKCCYLHHHPTAGHHVDNRKKIPQPRFSKSHLYSIAKRSERGTKSRKLNRKGRPTPLRQKSFFTSRLESEQRVVGVRVWEVVSQDKV